MHAVAPEVEVQHVARITIDKVDGEEFVFMVWNETKTPLAVERNAVVMVTPHDRRGWRAPGLARRFVTVPPGGVHDVTMEFSLEDLKKGDEVEIDFSGAVVSEGRPVQVPPFKFTVGQ